jgi:heat shock protein HtpX
VPPEEKLVKRVALFVLTNLAVLLVIGTLLQLLGVQGILDEHGVGIDVPSLLLLSLVVGMGGS